jgi:ubiquinone/menaquinone biosynthesis C-methylase UbiE
MQPFLTDVLACPACGADLGEDLSCSECGETYDRQGEVYDLVYDDDLPFDAIEAAGEIDDLEDDEITREEYDQYVNDETREAREKVGRAVQEPLQLLEGTVLDLATGAAGGLFAPQLGREGVTPIATDVSVDVLELLQQQVPEVEEPHGYLACNPRKLPVRDGALDAVTTAGGLNNLAGTQRILDEIYRVIGEDGEFLGLHVFVDPETDSAERAEAYHVEVPYLEDEFRQAAVDAGFEAVEFWLVDSAEAAENPYDVMPVAGDEQTYAVVRLAPINDPERSLQRQIAPESQFTRPTGRHGPM